MFRGKWIFRGKWNTHLFLFHVFLLIFQSKWNTHFFFHSILLIFRRNYSSICSCKLSVGHQSSHVCQLISPNLKRQWIIHIKQSQLVTGRRNSVLPRPLTREPCYLLLFMRGPPSSEGRRRWYLCTCTCSTEINTCQATSVRTCDKAN